jgi:2-polyprenyl-3-methyl-5-hydroxy-6-metoxy-1,4-benzoquinol methylase
MTATPGEPVQPNDQLNYAGLYEFRFGGVSHRTRREVWEEVGRFVWERMGRPRRVLDPAGGFGEFINAIPAEERWLVDVIDFPERDTNAQVKVVIGDIFDIELPRAHFDGVFASNILEHFREPEHVARFLERMRETLAPGGVIAVMGPNFKYCARDYFDCADHALPLTHVSIQEHLYAAGYAVTDVIPRFLPYSFRSRLPASRQLVALYLRTPILWRLQGKQFLVLGTPR